VGRQTELEEILDQVEGSEDHVKVVSLYGQGGVGKTTLSRYLTCHGVSRCLPFQPFRFSSLLIAYHVVLSQAYRGGYGLGLSRWPVLHSAERLDAKPHQGTPPDPCGRAVSQAHSYR
jgi:hypothetical protein